MDRVGHHQRMVRPIGGLAQASRASMFRWRTWACMPGRGAVAAHGGWQARVAALQRSAVVGGGLLRLPEAGATQHLVECDG